MGEIAYHYQTEFNLEGEDQHTDWINNLVGSLNGVPGTLNFIFCTDQELLEMNRKYLEHDYFTDIITFEYEEMQGLSGDLFISVDRVRENAQEQGVSFEDEVRRVMAHGLLHLAGFGDKSEEDVRVMREQESKALELFHVKHRRNV